MTEEEEESTWAMGGHINGPPPFPTGPPRKESHIMENNVCFSNGGDGAE